MNLSTSFEDSDVQCNYSGHAAFYNYDALDVPEDQEQLMGSIVEEV